MEKVIPPGLNYADMKPEAIENQIKMVKFLPLSNIAGQKPNDIVRFHLQGNGFFDPYSAYIKVRVQYDMSKIENPPLGHRNQARLLDKQRNLSGVFLDRSAHSLINRLVIRSQGTELERIEHYDVLAAMINDMVYSSEQKQMHDFEGFSSGSLGQQMILPKLNYTEYDYVQQAASFMLPFTHRADMFNNNNLGDRGFFKLAMEQGATGTNVYHVYDFAGQGSDVTQTIIGVDEGKPITSSKFLTRNNPNADAIVVAVNETNANFNWQRYPIGQYSSTASGAETNSELVGLYTSPNEMEFCIPIYSGIVGVLMPDKKLLPLSLLPLEVEFTINPHAFYPVGACSNRSNFTITQFEIWTHTLFFEQELHRSLESVVAENGILLHYTSFYLTPINTYNSTVIPKYHQLGCFLKSVEAIHWVFLYTSYIGENSHRKLFFSSHNLHNLQLRNGMDLIPSEPIQSSAKRSTLCGSLSYTHNQLHIEMLKAWNKMHDQFSTSDVNGFNFNIDCSYGDVLTKPEGQNDWFKQSQCLGKAQYGLSLVGEEIGQNKTIVSGKKTVLPFDLNFDGRKTLDVPSIMLSYLRADFIVYVRPDLVVSRLGL